MLERIKLTTSFLKLLGEFQFTVQWDQDAGGVWEYLVLESFWLFVKPRPQSPSPKSPIQGTGADTTVLWATTTTTTTHP